MAFQSTFTLGMDTQETALYTVGLLRMALPWSFLAALAPLKSAFRSASSSESLKDVLNEGGSWFGLAAMAPAALIYAYLISDVLTLAHQFPAWGKLAFAEYLFLLAIIAHAFFLNRDSAADYSIGDYHREELTALLASRRRSHTILLAEMIVWGVLLLTLVLWLLSLVHVPASRLTHLDINF